MLEPWDKDGAHFHREVGIVQQINATGVTATLIHFAHDSSGQWRIACMPNMTEFHKTKYHPVHHRSNDVRAVTCPVCKTSKEFTAAQRSLDAATKK